MSQGIEQGRKDTMTMMESIKSWFEGANQAIRLSTCQAERESPRYNLKLFARYGGEGPLIERRGNISIGGFCFEGERELGLGTEVSLQFRLPGAKGWIQAKGQVLGHARYSNWLGVRGQFTQMAFEDERRLARWLDEMTRDINTPVRPGVLQMSY